MLRLGPLDKLGADFLFVMKVKIFTFYLQNAQKKCRYFVDERAGECIYGREIVVAFFPVNSGKGEQK
jgi:hypothetical protein